MNIGIVGAGMIGRAWAIVFARSGFETQIWDRCGNALQDAMTAIRERLADLEQHGLLDSADTAWRCLHAVDDLPQAVREADFVQENVTESVEVKRAVFAELDVLARPEAVLLSSTSAIPASQFTAELAGRHRSLVAHPANPPYLIPLVEICAAPWTDPAVVERAVEFYRRCGQQPIVVRSEVPGFVLNRLQGALLSEAFRLVETGVVSASDVDVTMRHGLGLRWSFMGPFETIDLNAAGGLKEYCDRYGPFYSLLRSDPPDPQPWSRELVQQLDRERRAAVPRDQHAQRQAWRDRRLMQLAVHQRHVERQEAQVSPGDARCPR